MIKVTGTIRTDNLKGMDPKKKKALMKRYARLIVAKLRYYTPTRTGKLKAGWKIKIMDTKFIIKNDVDYGVYLDNGTTKAIDRTKGYMTKRAIREAVRLFKQREQGYLRNLLEIKKEY